MHLVEKSLTNSETNIDETLESFLFDGDTERSTEVIDNYISTLSQSYERLRGLYVNFTNKCLNAEQKEAC